MFGIDRAQSSILNSVHRTDNRMIDISKMLASGKNILNAAETGVVTRLNAEIAGFNAADANITKSRNVIDVAQAALKSVADIVTEMKTLATNAADGGTSAADKDKLQETFASLLSQIDDLVDSAEIDGVNLVSSTAADLSVQVGTSAADKFTVTAQSSDAATLGIDALDIGSTGDAAAAITALEAAVSTVSASQSSLTANDVGLNSRSNTIQAMVDNYEESKSSIEDANLEELQTEMVARQTQQAINYSLIGIMNRQTQSVLSIFR